MESSSCPSERSGTCCCGRCDVIASAFQRERVAAALQKSWSLETSGKWKADNPACGQCGVTALLVEELFGGEILKTERWGKKRLAYEVDKHRYGFYVLLRLQGNSAILPELERHYRLTEGIIKSLVIRLHAEPKEEPVLVAQEVLGDEEEHSPQDDEEDEEGR